VQKAASRRIKGNNRDRTASALPGEKNVFAVVASWYF
jgi:hypothetical protein